LASPYDEATPKGYDFPRDNGFCCHAYFILELYTSCEFSPRWRELEKLRKMLRDTKDLKERNSKIVKAYTQGYSQHMITQVLGLSQPAVFGVIKRSGGVNYHYHLFFDCQRDSYSS
jgi:hypothetical protein